MLEEGENAAMLKLFVLGYLIWFPSGGLSGVKVALELLSRTGLRHKVDNVLLFFLALF